jgi:hypothetical protein
MDPLELLRDSRKEISMAEHIATITLPLLRDNRVFVNILSHANTSVLYAMRSFLERERELKRLRMVPYSEELIRQLFFESAISALGLNISDQKNTDELEKVVKAHKKSQMELKRGDNYIIVLPDFNTITINEIQVKKYLSIAKDFISKVERGMTNGH